MKRKERNILFRILNAISSLVLVLASVYLFAFEVSLAAMASMVLALCCIAVPVVVAGESALEVVTGTLEALVDGVIDMIVGVFEAIGNLFN